MARPVDQIARLLGRSGSSACSALSYLVKPLADQIARAMREGIAMGGTYAEYSGASGSIPFTSGFLSMVHSRGIELFLRKRIHGLSP